MESNETIDPQVKKFCDLVDDIKIAMLVTISNGNVLHSVPLVTQEMGFDGSLWFLVSKASQVVMNIENSSHVVVNYAGSGKFVSAVGIAELVNDDLDKIHQLWSKTYEVWFPQGPNDPKIQLLKVEVEKVEYWEGHSYPVAKILEFAKYVTGSENIKIGDHGELNIRH
ncbi:MAG: pyridoxamine 5'-phosphate oxidase family protein [Bdellovibrionales bacterium]|nr:pyridoxamine 5'-phosphate oxidase family protein [Bdellovibrionales bacterium]